MRTLVVSPHPDDETLGAGGTIAALTSQGVEVTVLTVASHAPPIYPPEAQATTRAEAEHAHRILGVADSEFLDLPAVLLAETPVVELNAAVQRTVDRVQPQLVLVPFPDRHVDHRRVFDAALVACRPVRSGLGIQLVAAYETLSETHWNAAGAEPQFAAQWTVDITGTLERKLLAYACYESQVSAFPGPRSPEAVTALATFRGSQAGMAHGESFQIIRATFPPSALMSGSIPESSHRD